MLLALAACARQTASDTAPPDVVAELPGNTLDDDGDGLTDELPAPDRAFLTRVLDVAPDGAWVLANADVGYSDRVAVYAPLDPADSSWDDVAPVGTLTGESCCVSDVAFWGPDLDGDGHRDLYVGADDLRWAQSYHSSSTVYAWATVTTRDFSLPDALAERPEGEGAVVGTLVGPDGIEHLVTTGEGLSIVDALAFEGGEPSAWITRVSPVTMWGSAAIAGAAQDLDGDGVADLIADGADAPEHLVTFSGADLAGTTLDLADAAGTIATDADTRNHHSGAIADIDGDGAPDLVLSALREAASLDWYPGPLVGERTRVTTIPLADDHTGSGGATADVGDVDGDLRADLAVGRLTPEVVGEVYVLLGAAIAPGGVVSLESARWAWRSDTSNTEVWAGDLDADGLRDLALWSWDATLPDGTVSTDPGAEIHLGYGGPG